MQRQGGLSCLGYLSFFGRRTKSKNAGQLEGHALHIIEAHNELYQLVQSQRGEASGLSYRCKNAKNRF